MLRKEIENLKDLYFSKSVGNEINELILIGSNFINYTTNYNLIHFLRNPRRRGFNAMSMSPLQF